MSFENVHQIDINCEVESLRKSFDNIYWKPNHLNKLTHGCVSVKDLWDVVNEEKKCIECKITNMVETLKSTKDGKEEELPSKKQRIDATVDECVPLAFKACVYCVNGENDIFEGKLKNLFLKFFPECNYMSNFRCYLRKLIPRHTKKFSPLYECVAQETTTSLIRFIAIPICLDSNEDRTLLVHKSYGLFYTSNDKMLYAYLHNDFSLDSPLVSLVASRDWLVQSVLPKVKKWGETNIIHHSYRFESLINMERYSCLYFELKEKYASYFIRIWPENTDPLKFVYEDIAIATYLLLIWEHDRMKKNLSEKQSFVDLGCGNGLLVYILTKEGHPGKGIDIVKRKIWALYGDEIILEESTVLPYNLKVDVDWIVGNHTDELTPWIPIIAARSSYNVNYFVLPCCFYNFNRKFDNGAACAQSKYRNYLDFIVTIGKECGFKVEEDILKIPSTKRICSIGRSRSYEETKHHEIDEIVVNILKTNHCLIELDKICKNDGFSPREVIKDPKNSTQIDSHVKERIVDDLIVKLLEKENISSNEDDRLTSSGHKWSEWNAGDCISIPQCAELFNKELLMNLKDQSGGLQSLLRNHQRIFKIFGGMVALRDFRNINELNWGKKGRGSRRTDNLKTVGCWFYMSHPQGCVLAAEDCSYAHGEEDRRFYHCEK